MTKEAEVSKEINNHETVNLSTTPDTALSIEFDIELNSQTLSVIEDYHA